MSKAKRKRILCLSIVFLVIVAVIVTAFSIYVHIIHKNALDPTKPVKTGLKPLKEVISEAELPVGKYENLDFSEAKLVLPEKAETLHNYYRLLRKGKYSPEECTEIAWNYIIDGFGVDPDDLSTLQDMNGDHPTAITYTCDLKSEISLYDNAYRDNQKAADVFFIDDSEKAKEVDKEYGFAYRDWYYYCDFTITGSTYLQSYIDRYQTIQGTVVKEIDVTDDEQLDEAYLVAGVEYTPRQAMAFAESRLDLVKNNLGTDDYTPKKVIVIKNSENEYYSYAVLFQYLADSVLMLDTAPINVDIESDYSFSKMALTVSVSQPDILGGIFNSPYTIVGNDGEIKDKYLPLDMAVKRLNTYFADKYEQKFSEVSIRYAVKYNLHENSSLPDDTKLYVRPYWCFTKTNKNGFQYEPGFYEYREEYILVDMQTGEIFYYEPDTQCFISSFD